MADASAPSRLLEQFKDGSLTLEAYQTEIRKLYEAKELDMMALIQWVSKASEWKGSQKKPRAKTPKKEKDLYAQYQDNMQKFKDFVQTEDNKLNIKEMTFECNLSLEGIKAMRDNYKVMIFLWRLNLVIQV